MGAIRLKQHREDVKWIKRYGNGYLNDALAARYQRLIWCFEKQAKRNKITAEIIEEYGQPFLKRVLKDAE